MSNFQPITPYQPNTAILASNAAASNRPESPTTPSVIAATPTQTTPTYGAVKQLPQNIVIALASQQAVNNVQVPDKLAAGIIDCPSGVTFVQASAPGQAFKPGSGEFIQQVWEKAPALPFTQIASNVLFTGSYGVGSAENFVRNVPAQLGAVSGSIQNTTTQLTNSGYLSGREDPTQITGVIYAGTQNIEQTKAVLSGAGVSSAQIQAGTSYTQAVTAGLYAGRLADTQANGVNGVATSLGEISQTNGAALSTGITNFANQNPGGLEALTTRDTSVMQKAFNLAEKSFGNLIPNQENVLGGLPELNDTVTNGTVTTMLQLRSAREELAAAEAELVSARKVYASDGTDESYLNMRGIEDKIEQAKKKVAGLEQKLVQPIALPSVQDAATIANAQESGQLNAPTTANTGINAIPGGLNAFAGQIGSATSNIVGSIKTLATGVGTGVASLFSGLANPASLAGNLVSNVKSAIKSVANAIGGVGQGIASAIGNATGGLLSGVSGLTTSIVSAFNSLGNSPGQVKPAQLATNTYGATKAVVNSTLNKALDPRVPPPTFEEVVPTFSPNEYQQAQVDAQKTLTTLFAEREQVIYRIDALVDEYIRTQNVELVDQIDTLRNQVEQIDVQIVGAQKTYDRIVSGGAGA